MPFLLIIAAGSMVWFTCWQRQGCQQARVAAVHTFIYLTATTALLTEGLSLFAALRPFAITAAWGGVVTGAALLCRSSLRRLPIRRTVIPTLSAGEKGLLAIPVVIAALLLAIALAAPPTTYDAHTYHLPRIYHWIRQGSVEFFATTNGRQNYLQPLAEYAILHVRLLTGCDRLFNLVQWSGFIASLVLVSLLARECGLTRRGQLLATAIAATVPMVILQATSCQNDLFAASFCLALTYGLIRLSSPEGQARDAWLCGLALGCALLAKGTSYIFCLPPLFIFGIRQLINLHHQGWRSLVKRWTLIAGLALVINAGFYARNIGVYGHPLPTPTGAINQQISATTIAENSLRNAASHLGTPFPAWNQTINHWINRLAGRGETFSGYEFRASFTLFEDDTGNFAHLLLALCAIVVLAIRRTTFGSTTGLLILSFLLAYGLLSALLLWQPWGTRFQTFLFLLLAPVCACALERTRRLALQLALGLALAALPFLLINVSRPVISLTLLRRVVPPELREILRHRPSVFLAPRLNQYFGRDTTQRHEYEEAMRWLPPDPATPVGLLTGGDDPEFRLWVIAEQISGHLPRLIPLASDTPRLLPPLHLRPGIIFDTRPAAKRTPPFPYSAATFTSQTITVWNNPTQGTPPQP
ncbi:MAG: ArnT family glycosyltransferase [Kiritimatiellia bacterium]